ncbi:hypothetical protein [Xanthocytophaga agilis]|uniref:Type 1 periplasmic binding fold superfamily protein n=1 Tax=Xanthocytophaga agilis TaxID=3048010 RepID=A0AAE3UFF5_9BACT|nr:hypothetical protein [Xanthocytophaga agilis]MDJ1503803.1 hypothetical protein [Xanthocytophaga agilis]
MTNHTFKTMLLWTGIASLAVFSSCSKEDDPEPLEQELITTVTLSLTKSGSSTPVSISFKDPEGDGSGTITPDTLVLEANASYTGALTILNETLSSTAEGYNVTAEIEEEAIAHQFYYQATGAQLTVTTTDVDSNNLPLGLKSTIATTTASKGTLKITLKHKPGEKAAGDTITKGETDVEVVFPVKIQ